MPVGRVKAAFLSSVVAVGVARAHVAPSRDVNNRYLRATLLPDRVRLTYTLLFGDLPAAAERRRMDADGDGRLAPAESAAFGARVAAELVPRLAVTLDGAAQDAWRVVDVGLGQPTVAGGAFAVDLELDARIPGGAADEHRLTVDDFAALPAPGEVELLVDESPGVRVLESHLAGERAGIELRYLFTGNAAAAGERAVLVRFRVDPSLRPPPPRSRAPLIIAAAVAAACLAAFLALRKKWVT